jgi:hypothetical protein
MFLLLAGFNLPGAFSTCTHVRRSARGKLVWANSSFDEMVNIVGEVKNASSLE